MASAAAIRSDGDLSSKLSDITKDNIEIDDKFVDDVFTQEVMIEPYKIIDCNHVFEKLPLKKLLYKYDRVCPRCRAEISKIVPDVELAKKIQEEFVAISEANKAYFNKTKTELENDKDYESVRDKPDMPAKLITREDDLDTDILVEILRDDYLDAQPIISYAISRGNLLYAEQLNDRMPNAYYFKNFNYTLIINEYIFLSNIDAAFLQNAAKIYDKIMNKDSKISMFHKIFDAYLKTTYLIDAENFLDTCTIESIKSDNSYYSRIIDIYLTREFDLLNMQIALKTASKISNVKTKESYITKITHKLNDNNKYMDAFKSANNITNFFERLSLFSLVTKTVISCYLRKIANGFLFSFKAIKIKLFD